MKILRKPLSELQPAGYNPRSITDAALKGLRASIQRFGLVEPIIWNERTGNVVGGHQRLKVLLADGVAETDVVVVDLPDVEERALNVALNNPAIAGDFTDEIRDLIAGLSLEIPEAVSDLRLDALLEQVADAFDVEAGGFPELADGDREPFQQMTFTLADWQAEHVNEAMKKAKAAGPFVDTGNENSNGNALHRIAEAYLGAG